MMAAAQRQPYTSNYGHSPSSFDFQPSSPLETLVRRTSSRRNPPGPRPPNVVIPSNTPISKSYHVSQTDRHGQTKGLDTPPKTQTQTHQQQLSPVSPLIHSHFRGASNASGSRSNRSDTASAYEDSSFMEMDEDYDNPRDVFARDGYGRDSFDSRTNSNIYNSYIYAPDAQQRFRYDDEGDSPLESASALRDSWQSGPVHDHDHGLGQAALRNMEGQQYHYARGDSFVVEEPDEPSSPSSPVPAVVVTSPESAMPMPRAGGRVPIVRNVGAVSNYSRPVRGPSESEEWETQNRNSVSEHRVSHHIHDHEDPTIMITTMNSSARPRHNSSAAPILDAEVFDPESKRRVLERNMSKNRRRVDADAGSPSSISSSSFPVHVRTGSPSSLSPMDSQHTGGGFHNNSGRSSPSSSSLSPSVRSHPVSRELTPSPLSQPLSQTQQTSRARSPQLMAPSPLRTSQSHPEITL
ncbi:hypothetical protein FB446DRAFT_171704 [Lentinula raphanica]|nr:hypothetical protein FB446DRAFT_171704 [Lentinula raphanica]